MGRATDFSGNDHRADECDRSCDRSSQSPEHAMPIEIAYPVLSLAFLAVYAMAAGILVQTRRGSTTN